MPIASDHLVLLAVALTVGCAPHASPASPRDPAARESLVLTRHELTPGRHCAIVDPDVPLPAIESVIDTAAMPDYLHQARVSVDSGYALFSLRYDSTGKPVRAWLIEATFADSLRDPMRLAITSALVARPAGAPLAARLRVDLTPAPVYRLGKSEYCAPERVPEPIMPSPNGVTLTKGPTSQGSVVTYKYDVAVSADGSVEDIRFISPIDARLANDLRNELVKQRWKPAIDDGRPVSAHTVSVVTLETGRVMRRVR